MKSYKYLIEESQKRVLVMDGAMGTMIQQYNLSEQDYRASIIPSSHKITVRGANDLLCLTQPSVIAEIHRNYLEAGSDIIETNTFNANFFSLSDYGLEAMAVEINKAGAEIARRMADEFMEKNPGRRRFVAGSIGPSSKTLSLSHDVEDSSIRSIDFDQLESAYFDQSLGLILGGVDMLIIETVFDTLNAKAAVVAANRAFEQNACKLPIILSMTVGDKSGRNLSGQTPEAFYISLSHAGPFAIGLNCGLGAAGMIQYIEELATNMPFLLCAYPNAGMPDGNGNYEESAEEMVRRLLPFFERRMLNIVGGCCGTTPEHIRLIAQLASKYEPRKVPVALPKTILCGLDTLEISRNHNFVNIGERTNVAGSRKFADLVKEQKYSEALQVARQQVESGAQIIDISMDDPMLDAVTEMPRFLNLLASEPDIARVPFMIDSSDWAVIHSSLKCIQGKAIVNSISLKDGEAKFLEKATIIRNFGAAVVVMAFDEDGQATTYNRKISICERAYNLLTGKINFPPQDIIFDANILTIGTGMDEHNSYALDFINSVKWIKENLSHSKTSGGVSNLSFAFRGKQQLREALHSVFLYHAIDAGLDMAIVNAGALPVYSEIPEDLREIATDLILNRRSDATSRLTEFILKSVTVDRQQGSELSWRESAVNIRIEDAVIKGIGDFLPADLDEILKSTEALAVIEGPLMLGMKKVGELFGQGKLFLPQVIKSARIMRQAVSVLQPMLEKDRQETQQSSILLATVRGDVHDIGKNIVAIVLGCNNFRIVDAGVMVPSSRIIELAIKEKVNAIGLSGLITPSLEEMKHIVDSMNAADLQIPIFIGGATTSAEHTAIHIAPLYKGPVIHIKDASLAPESISKVLSRTTSEAYLHQISTEYAQLRKKHIEKLNRKRLISIEKARSNALRIDWDETHFIQPNFIGRKILHMTAKELIPYINWTSFLYTYGIKMQWPSLKSESVKHKESSELICQANDLIEQTIAEGLWNPAGVMGIFPANSKSDDIILFSDEKRDQPLKTLHFLRNQEQKQDHQPNLCCADFVAPERYADFIGLFAVSSGSEPFIRAEELMKQGDEEHAVMLKILADRLVEAFAEKLHFELRKTIWGYQTDEEEQPDKFLKGQFTGIRPAPGYPGCPDHSEKQTIFDILNPQACGISLTETMAMTPAASICGYYFSHIQASYFQTGIIGQDQVIDYAKRKEISVEEAAMTLNSDINDYKER